MRAERVARCGPKRRGALRGLGRPGEREREEEADRAGLGRAAGPAEKVGPRGGRWVWAGKLGLGLFSIYLSLFYFYSKQSLNFEFKPHSNKIMHQHECDKNLNL